MYYIITAEEEETDTFTSGILLSIKEAANPEDAINEMAKQIVDNAFLELTNKEDIDAETRVKMALGIIQALGEKYTVIKIYRVDIDEKGNPAMLTSDELEFESHNQSDSDQ